jgi:hypothetical protein
MFFKFVKSCIAEGLSGQLCILQAIPACQLSPASSQSAFRHSFNGSFHVPVDIILFVIESGHYPRFKMYSFSLIGFQNDPIPYDIKSKKQRRVIEYDKVHIVCFKKSPRSTFSLINQKLFFVSFQKTQYLSSLT